VQTLKLLKIIGAIPMDALNESVRQLAKVTYRSGSEEIGKTLMGSKRVSEVLDLLIKVYFLRFL
jgi:hypothetical protein